MIASTFTLSIVLILTLRLFQWLAAYQEAVVDFIWCRSHATKLQTLTVKRKELHREQQSVSAQDQYARWTKLNRQISQLDTEITNVTSQLVKQRQSGIQVLSRLRLLLFTIPLTVLKFWKGKLPVFSLPSDLFPHMLKGIMSQGWAAAALGPIRYVLKGPVQVTEMHIETTVCLAIWLGALTRVIDTTEFVVRNLCN